MRYLVPEIKIVMFEEEEVFAGSYNDGADVGVPEEDVDGFD